MVERTTIFALSSGALPSGVGVIRISGPKTRFGLEILCGRIPEDRRAELVRIRDPETGETIDRGLAIFMEGPRSFTGEDVGELQLHGSKAVIQRVLVTLGRFEGFSAADRGAFAKRAFNNGRLDLTEIEGLADLIDAETENQRRQALRQMEGGLRERAEDWRKRLITMRAEVEARLDFADEDDVPMEIEAGLWGEIGALNTEVEEVLRSGGRGRRVRDGVEVVVLGKPNVGKTSLVNRLSEREVGIVTELPGTTRDLLESWITLGGYPVELVDTAGLRQSTERIEQEGIRRTVARSRKADIVLWLSDGSFDDADIPENLSGDIIKVRTKADLGGKDEGRENVVVVSSITGEGFETLRSKLERLLVDICGGLEPAIVTRERQERALQDVAKALTSAAQSGPYAVELAAEDLRAAGDALGRLVGRIDVEDVLDSIFAGFCIGK